MPAPGKQFGTDFTAVGGYDEGRLIGEDVVFLMALRQMGKERGQRLIRLTDVRALVSMRKFAQHGDWHALKMMPSAMQAVLWPSMGRKLADRYWYNNDR